MPNDLETRLHNRANSKGVSASTIDAAISSELELFVKAIKDVLKTKYSVPYPVLKKMEHWLINSEELKTLVIDYIEIREKKGMNGNGTYQNTNKRNKK